MSSTPEIRSLLELTRAAIVANSVEQPARDDLDWNTLFRHARRHGLASLSAVTLERNDWPGVPADVRSTWQAHVRAGALWNRMLGQCLADIIDRLQRSDVRVAALKGPTLAATAYGHVSLRPFSDLDILVHPGDRERASQTLIHAGFRPEFPIDHWPIDRRNAFFREGYHQAFVAPTGKWLLELHWSLAARHFHWRDAGEVIWTRLGTSDCGDRRIPVLGPLDTLPYLCFHGAKHGWQRLEWIAAIAGLVHRTPDVPWDAVLDRSRRESNESLLLAGLSLAHTLYRLEIPDRIGERCRRRGFDRRFAEQVLDRAVSETSSTSSPLAKHWFYMSLRERWRDRLTYAAYHILHASTGEQFAHVRQPVAVWRLPRRILTLAGFRR